MAQATQNYQERKKIYLRCVVKLLIKHSEGLNSHCDYTSHLCGEVVNIMLVARTCADLANFEKTCVMSFIKTT